MEQYRSVFATTAVMVLSLVGASHLAYPRSPEGSRSPVAVERTPGEANAPSAWTEPTDRMAERPDSRQAPLVTVAAPAPASFTRLPAETATLFATVPQAASDTGRPVRPVAVAKRQRNVRQTAGGEASAVAPTVARTPPNVPDRPAKHVDVIGDLLRGLGVGRDG